MSIESKPMSLNNNDLIVIEMENNHKPLSAEIDRDQETCSEDLPIEMWTKIAGYLDSKDIMNLRLVSSSMHGVVEAHLEITWNALKIYPFHKDLQIKSFINGTENSWRRDKLPSGYMTGFKMLNSINSHSEIFDYEDVPIENRVLLTFNAFYQLSQSRDDKEAAEKHGDCMLWNQLTKGTHQPLVPEVNFDIIHSCLSNDYNYRQVHTALQENLREKNGHIQLRGLFIKTLSNRMSSFQGIRSINLSYNQLNVIPSCIFDLQRLTMLNLSHNKIKIIPNEISKLEKLDNIDLSYNQIKTIPNELSKLEYLEILNLNENNISEINNSISEMHKIERVYLKSNPITIVGNNFKYNKTFKHYTNYTFSTKHAQMLYQTNDTPYAYTYSKVYIDPIPDNKPITSSIKTPKKHKNECVIS